jgi:DNA-binding NarL/FixJ family response regulator
MSLEGQEQFIDWNQFTFTRVRILSALADLRSEREIAGENGISYSTVRGHVEELKNLVGERDVRNLGRWWRHHAPAWHRWCAQQAGLDDGETGRIVG